MTAAILAVPGVAIAPSWPVRWWRAFVRLLPLAFVYMLVVALKDLPLQLFAFSTPGWRYFLQSWIGELLGAVFLVGFVAAVDLLPLGGRARLAADAAAVLLTQFAGGIVVIAILDAVGAFNGRFTFLQLLLGNAGASTVEAAFALVLYRLWQRQRRRTAALGDMQRAHVELLRKTAQADLVAMQARIDPAFLFATLDDAERLYESDPVHGRRLIDALIDYLRAVLPGVDSVASTLGKECDIACTYVEVARARGSFVGSPCVEVPPGLRGAPFPPMVVTPLVEDAVRSLGAHPVQLSLVARDEAERLVATLSADRTFAPSADTVALVRQRLAELAPGATLNVAAGTSATRIVVEIPHEASAGADR